MANQLHTMPLKCEALMSSGRCRAMELDEFGAYLTLLCFAWLDGARLPQNERSLRKLVSPKSDEQWERIKKFVIEKMFKPTDDGDYLINEHQVIIWNEVLETLKTKTNRAKKAADARWNNNDANALHKHCLSNANQNQSQKKGKENIIKENPGIDDLIITNTLETLDIPEKIKKLFVDWVKVRVMCHGKLPAQSQDFQLDKLLKIPAELREKSLKAAISGTWKNIGQVEEKNTGQDETSTFRSTGRDNG